MMTHTVLYSSDGGNKRGMKKERKLHNYERIKGNENAIAEIYSL
jgi:hypothetical protein